MLPRVVILLRVWIVPSVAVSEALCQGNERMPWQPNRSIPHSVVPVLFILFFCSVRDVDRGMPMSVAGR